MKSLTEIIQRRDALAAERLARVKAHETFLRANDQELRDLQFAEALVAGGVDLEKIGRGRNIVYGHGQLTECPGRGSAEGDSRALVVAEARSDIAQGAPQLLRTYFGIKSYASFGDQRCDCSYGAGPAHGTIVFRIGLTDSARQQINSGTPLSSEQIEDALYFLTNLSAIERANTVAV